MCWAHVGIRFIALHPHSTATGQTYRWSTKSYTYLHNDITILHSTKQTTGEGSDALSVYISAAVVVLVTTSAVIGNIVSCVDVFVLLLPQTYRHRDHSDSSSY